MTVKVDVNANPTTVVQAFDRIQAALQRARREAADFAAVDLRHSELDGLEEQIKRITAGLQAMRQTAATASVLHPGRGPLLPQSGPAAPLSPGASARPVSTQPWAPPPGNPVAPSGTGLPIILPSLPPSASSGTSAGGMLSLLRAPIGLALSLAGLSGAKSMAGQAVGEGDSEAVDNDRLLRTLRDSTGDFDALRESVRKAAGGIGATFGDTQAMALRYARTAGSDVGSVVDQVKFAAGLARGYGIDQATMSDMAARGENAGINPKDLAAAAADATEAGGMQGRTQEVLSALLKWSESASRVLVNSNQMTDFARMYTGLNATGLKGFQGQNAESLINTINGSLSQGGAAGMAGQVFLSRALSAHGVTNPYSQKFALSGGMFQHLAKADGGDGTTVFEAMMQEADKEYKGVDPEQKYIGIGNLTGLNPHVVKSLFENYHPGEIGRTEAILGRNHMSMKDINESGLADIAGVAHARTPGELSAIRDRTISGRKDLSQDEIDQLKTATGDNLRDTLVRVFGKHGMTGNAGTNETEANVDLSNALTKIGSELIPALAEMKKGAAALTDELAKGAEAFRQFWNNGTRQGPDGTPSANDLLAPPGGSAMGGQMFPVSFRTMSGGRGGGSGGGGTPLAGSALAERTKQAMAYFERQGWSHDAAAGIVANLIKESGLREGAVGDRGAARGLMQWHGGRFDDVANGIGMDPTSSFQAGLAGVQYELTRGHDAGMRDTGIYLRGGHGAAANGSYFSSHGERPGDRFGAEYDRGNLADDLSRMPSGGSYNRTARIEPLKVIHMLPNGRVLREQSLPVQQTLIPRVTEL